MTVRRARLAARAVVALLPMPLKRVAYRLQGFEVARSARVGCSIIDASKWTAASVGRFSSI